MKCFFFCPKLGYWQKDKIFGRRIQCEFLFGGYFMQKSMLILMNFTIFKNIDYEKSYSSNTSIIGIGFRDVRDYWSSTLFNHWHRKIKIGYFMQKSMLILINFTIFNNIDYVISYSSNTSIIGIGYLIIDIEKWKLSILCRKVCWFLWTLPFSKILITKKVIAQIPDYRNWL